MRKGPLEDDLQYIAKYPLQYEQLKETTVLVTGATGLIGASIVRALIAVEGIHIIALVRNIEKANKLYDKQMRTGKVAKFCCDFKALEEVADRT